MLPPYYRLRFWKIIGLGLNYSTTPCNAEKLSEIEKFKLIAAESLALRKARGLKDADTIGIVPFENEQNKKVSSKFNCENNSEQISLSSPKRR